MRKRRRDGDDLHTIDDFCTVNDERDYCKHCLQHRQQPKSYYWCVRLSTSIIISYICQMFCEQSSRPISYRKCWPAKFFGAIVTLFVSLLHFTLTPYRTLSPLLNQLNRRSHSILLSSYILLISASSYAYAELPIQGLRLNSFIPHFEPLYYDRGELLQQYTRLKRSVNEKQTIVEQHRLNGNRKRDTSQLHPIVIPLNVAKLNPSTNKSSMTMAIATTTTTTSTTSTITTTATTIRNELIDQSGSGTSKQHQQSTASTTAFYRHNCPTPEHHHHHHHHSVEDSTEKGLPNHTTNSNNNEHSTKSTLNDVVDGWLQYEPERDIINDHDTDTDASIDIDENEMEHKSIDSKPHIRIEFTAHNRHFRLILYSHSERVFADNPIFETSHGATIPYDLTKVVRGHLEDDDETLFEGIITQDGFLDGHLITRNDEFYIEPAYHHFGANHDRDFHSVIYSISVVDFPNATHGSASPYLGSKYLPLVNPFGMFYNQWNDEETQWSLLNNIEEILHLNPSNRRQYKRPKRSSDDASSAVQFETTGTPIWSYGRNHSFVNDTDNIGFEIRYKTNSNKKSSGSFGGSVTTSSTSTSRIPFKAEHFRKGVTPKSGISNNGNNNMMGNGVHNGHDHGRYWRDMDSLHYTESEPYGIKAVHPRTHWIDDQRHHDRHVVVDPKKTTCMLYLQADHLFFEKMGSEEACIESMTRHVQKVNNIYKNTDFDQDGRPDNISFLIKRIKVHTMEALKDPEYRYPSTYGVEKFLELFSEEDYDAFCLAYMFTYRDFEGGTLGLAWTGDLKNAGGVCEKNGHYRGSLKSLNTGIVTLLNYGKHVPPIVSHVTLAHEIGHNFGSPHDPEDDHACTPGGENGNYIMFARATSGDKRNNNKFSPCSLRSINAVLNTKAKSLKGCFQEPQDAICGNEVVEEGEECDCGWEEDCKEPCCFPMRANPPADEPPCRLRPNVICSPSQGPCCTQDCKLKVGNKCRDDNGCRTASYCNGQGPQCPPSTNKPNKTICNEESVCYMGECTGSICMAYGLESCQCKQGPNDPPTKLCELCCRMPSDDSTCKSSFDWNTTPYDVPDLNSKPGTPCDNYNGYCDISQRCREVDPSSPLATLRRLLLSNESMASLKRWFNEQWFYVAVLIMISI
ncbi:hypothetical protein RDWZM_001165 [Blomia tropicalis]|uniref:ADAM10 endopeptidase n=1 Tax=Blomia tropicalis TaxID=40697 RepID=A0A9Q0MFJ2_BLOTA|nr:hypothetical protein RDWZM_001165 [Blomia tropicalis]